MLFTICNEFFKYDVLNVTPSKCVSMNNQECKIRTKLIDINNNELSFYLYSIEVNICSGICNNINDPYAKLCIPNVVKNLNIKAFNLISRTNETRHIELHETYKCKCRLDTGVCNDKQIYFHCFLPCINFYFCFVTNIV